LCSTRLRINRSEGLVSRRNFPTFRTEKRFYTRSSLLAQISNEEMEKSKTLTGEDNLETQKEKIRNKKGFIIDMDGVLYHQNHPLPGITEFLGWIREKQKKYVFLTNGSEVGREELAKKMERLTGLKIPKEHFYTSAIATATFLHNQTPGGSAYVVGSHGLTNALSRVGYTINDTNPDYVVVGETQNYNFHMIERAVHHVKNGARLVGTNRDILDRAGTGVIPSTGTLVAPIEIMTGTKAYFIGKPNPLIMSHALKALQTPIEETVIIGDRMDTDIQAGLEVGIDTVLVLSGVTTREDLKNWAFKPNVVLGGIIDLVEKK